MKIADLPNAAGLIRGACTRILFDKEEFPLDQTANRMFFALSNANDTIYSANWLEGFLHGSGLLIIHNPRLWNILNIWVEEMEMLNFMNMLPLLRRTFSEFSGPERTKMLELAKQGELREAAEEEKETLDVDRAESVLPTLKLLLGYEL